MKSVAKGYFDSGVISHDICNHEIQDIGHTVSDMMYWIHSFSQSINQMNKIHSVKKIKWTRSVQSTHKSIQINLINQSIKDCGSWCNISWNLNQWDTGYWAYINRYDILDSFIQQINQITRSIPSTNQINKVSPIN